MIKRGLLLIVIIFFSQCVFAYSGLDLNLTLNRAVYGKDVNFDGYLLLNYSGFLSGDDVLKGNVYDCGSYNEKSINLKTLFTNAGISGFSEEYYNISGSSQTSLTKTFSSTGDYLFGFNLNSVSNDYINNASMKIQGTGGPVSLDIGNDGNIDWDYNGNFLSWSNNISYPIGIDGSVTERETYQLPQTYGACEEIVIKVDRKYDPLDIKINARVKGSGGTYLNASISDLRLDCSLPLSQINANSFSDVSCDIKIVNPYYENNELTLEVCLITNGNYRVPSYVDNDVSYYFVNIKKANYNLIMNNSIVTFSGINFQEALQDYLEDCYLEGVYCTIPVNLSIGSSGSITLSNLEIEGDTISNYFYNIQKVPGKKEVDGTLSIGLGNFTNLKTPSQFGKCKLQLEFEGDETSKVNFSVVELPIAKIKVNSKYVAVNVPIEFDGGGSYSPKNYSINSYAWSFGDNTSGSGEKISHSYSSIGNYTVSLVVKDNNSVQSEASQMYIYVGPLEGILGSLINDTMNEVDEVEENLDNLTGINKDIKDALKLMDVINKVQTDLNGLMVNFTSVKNSSSPYQVKENKYEDIAEALELLKQEIPNDVDILTSLSVNNLVLKSVDDVPMYKLREDSGEDYSEAIYFFNVANVKVNMESYLVKIGYLYKDDEKIVYVEKDVTASDGEDKVVVESLSEVIDDLSQVSVLTSGASLDEENNVIYFNMESSSINYKYILKIDEPIQINSVVFSDVEFNKCGDGVCSLNEDCEKDCKKAEFPWIWYIVLGAILAAGIYYFNFYSGPGNFKDKANKASVKVFGKRLFTNDQDLINLKNYVKDALRKGFREEDIRKVLLSKGWTNKQIDYAFGEKFK